MKQSIILRFCGIAGLSAALVLTTIGAFQESVQEQTNCSKCNKVLQPDWKFCECGEPTEYGKYSSLLAAAQKSYDSGKDADAARNFVDAAKRRVSAKRKGAALLGAGRAYNRLRRYDEAANELDKSIRFEPTADAHMLLGEIELTQRRNFDKAEENFLAATRISGKPELTAALLGDIQFERKNFAEARKYYELVDSQNLNNATFQYRLGRSILSSSRDLRAAGAKFQLANKIQPKWIEPVIEIALLSEELRDYSQAATFWGKAADLQKDNERYPLRQGLNLYLVKDWKGADAAFRATLQRNPNQMEALLGLGRLGIYHLRDPRAARPFLERAVSIDSKNRDADFLLGLCQDLVDPKPLSLLIGGTTCERALAWHPDGRMFTFMSNREKAWHIYAMRVGGRAVKLTNAGQNGDPCWSPDGKKIAYHGDLGDSEIYIMDADGGNVQRLTTRPKINDESPAWSPDGKKIVFQSNEAGRDNWELYWLDVDTKEIERLTNSKDDDQYAKFSPDGKSIVFMSRRTGQKDIYVMDLTKPTGDSKKDKYEVRRLTNDKPDDNWPSFSPDGKRILYSSKKSGKWKLYTMRFDGQDVQPLTSGTDDELEGAWNPNGLRIAGTFGKDPKIETFDLKSVPAGKGYLPTMR